MSRVRKSLLFLTILVTCQSISSCHKPDKLTEKAEYMADLECRAIALREQRFALANSIRFTQDTLLHLKAPGDSIRLNKNLRIYLGEKDTILQASLQLADTIHLSLDSLRKYTFTNADDKHLFEKKLKEAMKKQGCEL